MQQTTNYKLNKPEASDYADIKPVSDNMDIIDTELKKAQNHREDNGIHVKASEKQEWNGKAPGSLVQTVSSHTGNGNIHVTAQDKQKWNGYRTVIQLSHQKSGNVHQLTGLSGVSGTVSAVFTATAGYKTGDTFTVDGTAYTIQLSNGETAEDNLFVSGAAVPIVLDTAGKKVNFKAGGGKKKLVTELILASQEWFVPEGVKSVNVRIFGGGGSGELSPGNEPAGGGGGGHMEYGTIEVTPGSSIPITIGLGGEAPTTNSSGRNGGASSFGSYLTANGGSGGSGGYGGDGGSGGGAGRYSSSYPNRSGGDATYGGGGGGPGGGGSAGGNGGMYGGGGGAGSSSNRYGSGGEYGGNGGYSSPNTPAENGTDTTGIEGLDFIGQGLAGNNYSSGSNPAGGGGGGYGGNGGNGGTAAGGGGGGYGGNGGNGTECGGGGGGYGGNGGNGRTGYSSWGGAGGGGYGKAGNGGDGGTHDSTPAGNGGIAAGGGGNTATLDGYNSITTRTRAGNGGNGICIITYMV